MITTVSNSLTTNGSITEQTKKRSSSPTIDATTTEAKTQETYNKRIKKCPPQEDLSSLAMSLPPPISNPLDLGDIIIDLNSPRPAADLASPSITTGAPTIEESS